MTTQDLDTRIRRIERELSKLLIALKAEIRDEYRENPDDLPGIAVTIGTTADCCDWNYQTGDNSFSGGAYSYPFWGVGRLYRRSNCKELAAQIVADAINQITI